MAQWRNWSGSVQAHPQAIVRPRTEAELSRRVAEASEVRVVGAGHSFMPLCATEGLLLDLSELEGGIEVMADGTVDCPAGWSLARLTAALWEKGFSLPNQGDVNPQSLAGSISTGTHGTGETLGSLSTFARAFRIVGADGTAVECDAQRRPELFQAARLSLGLLGVVTRIRLAVLPAFHLEERIERKPLAEVLERFDDWAAARRHVEFFCFPYADDVILKTLNEAPAEGEFKPSNDIDDRAFRLACDWGQRMPAAIPMLHRMMMKASGRSTRRVGPAYQIFPSDRTIPFEEMEYEMPRAAGLPTLKAAIDRIRARKLPVTFPFEFRTVAADDIQLSPFHAGGCASISMHQYAPMPWQGVFGEVEPLLREGGGRPHWAKRHSLTERDVHALYPKAADFLRVRRDVDPEAKFTNAPMRALFGIDARVPAHV